MTDQADTEQPEQDILAQLREAAEALERSSQQLAETIEPLYVTARPDQSPKTRPWPLPFQASPAAFLPTS
ncbi:hypothetical protein AB0N81_12980 [Streptomyces sp. NPDC093510]|uniref:hypothetical protein n=1 Tax=Streptomyces sp. NPDC093510 TaxID=3155199 RepID=UPI003446224D